MDFRMISILIISSSIAIIVSFLCSLAEAMLLSLNPLAINRLQAVSPRSADAWRRLKRNISQPITAILVLNTVAHTGGATVAGGAFLQLFGSNNIWIFSVLFTLVILLGTEILPKIIGVIFLGRLAPYVGPVLEITTKALHPFVLLSEAIFSRLISERESEQITTADLITLAALARSGKVIGLEQENIIINAIRLSHTTIGRAMIPVDRVEFIKQGDTPEAILARAQATGHSRYPVSRTREARDIFAYIRIKHAIPSSAGEVVNLVAAAKPIPEIKSHETLMAGLRAMLSRKEHLFSVVNAQNKCVGIITLEDIAGELLGADIEDFK